MNKNKISERVGGPYKMNFIICLLHCLTEFSRMFILYNTKLYIKFYGNWIFLFFFWIYIRKKSHRAIDFLIIFIQFVLLRAGA